MTKTITDPLMMIRIQGRQYRVRACDCGPTVSGEHSPDCRYLLDCEEAADEHRDWKWQRTSSMGADR